MIGQRIESESGPPWGAIAWLVIALAVAGLTFVGGPAWLVAAILPAAIGVAVLIARPRRFAATLTPAGLVVGDDPEHGQLIAFDAMQGLFGVGRNRLPSLPGRRRFEIRLSHPGGVLSIPRRLNVSSDDLYCALAEHIPDWGVRAVHPALQEYRERMERLYGADRVWAFGAAAHLAARTTYAGLRAGSVAVALAGVAWIAAGALMNPDDSRGPGAVFVILGISLVFFGLLFLLASFASWSDRTMAQTKKWRESSVVIAPAGLALAQGDIVGELPWGQLQDVRITNPPAMFSRRNSFQLTTSGIANGIALKVPGTTIVIADVYERPLFILFDHIHTYWRDSGKKTAAAPGIPEL